MPEYIITNSKGKEKRYSFPTADAAASYLDYARQNNLKVDQVYFDTDNSEQRFPVTKIELDDKGVVHTEVDGDIDRYLTDRNTFTDIGYGFGQKPMSEAYREAYSKGTEPTFEITEGNVARIIEEHDPTRVVPREEYDPVRLQRTVQSVQGLGDRMGGVLSDRGISPIDATQPMSKIAGRTSSPIVDKATEYASSEIGGERLSAEDAARMEESPEYRDVYWNIRRKYGVAPDEYVAQQTEKLNTQFDTVLAEMEKYRTKIANDDSKWQGVTDSRYNPQTGTYDTPINPELQQIDAIINYTKLAKRDLNDSRTKYGEKDGWHFGKRLWEGGNIIARIMPFVSQLQDIQDVLIKYGQAGAANQMVTDPENMSDKQLLLHSLTALEQSVDQLQEDMGGKHWASGASESIQEMPAFMMGMPFAKLFSKAVTKGATKGLARLAGKAVTEVAAEAAETAAETVARRALDKATGWGKKWAKSFGRSAIEAPTQTLFYKSLAEENLGQYQVRPDGSTIQIVTPAWQRVYRAWLGTALELHSEDMGMWIGKGLNALGRRMANVGFVRGLMRVPAARSPLMEVVRKELKVADPLSEALGEVYGDAIQPLFTGDLDWSQTLADPDYWLTTVVSSAGVSVAMELPSIMQFKRDADRVNKDGMQMDYSLAVMGEDLRGQLVAAVSHNSIADQTKAVANIDWKNVSRQDMAAAMDYVSAYVSRELYYNSYREAERMRALQRQMNNLLALSYRGESGYENTMSTIKATAKPSSGLPLNAEYYIISGDITQQGNQMLNVLRVDQGTPTREVVFADQINIGASTDIADQLAKQYDLMFGEELAREGVVSISERIAQMRAEGVNEETIREVVSEDPAYHEYKEGDVVTDNQTGEPVTINEQTSTGEYIATKSSGERIAISYDQIADSGAYAEQAIERERTSGGVKEGDVVSFLDRDGEMVEGAVQQILSDGRIYVSVQTGENNGVPTYATQEITPNQVIPAEAQPAQLTPTEQVAEEVAADAAAEVQATEQTAPAEVPIESQPAEVASTADPRAIPTLEDGSIDYDAIEDPQQLLDLYSQDLTPEEIIEDITSMRDQSAANAERLSAEVATAQTLDEKKALRAQAKAEAAKVYKYQAVLDLLTPATPIAEQTEAVPTVPEVAPVAVEVVEPTTEEQATKQPKAVKSRPKADNGVKEWYQNLRLSGEFDQNNSPFVLNPGSSIDFGQIQSYHNLPPAPIRLAMGDVENGYIHINRRHGKEIQKAGFTSIEEFVQYVANNITRIQEGESYPNEMGGSNDTYLVQAQDGHNNTLFLQLSRDGEYWNVNSAGVFKKSYGNSKKNIWSASEVQSGNSAVAIDGSQSKPNADEGSTSNGTPSNISENKDTTTEPITQEVEQENLREFSDLQKSIDRKAAAFKAQQTRKARPNPNVKEINALYPDGIHNMPPYIRALAAIATGTRFVWNNRGPKRGIGGELGFLADDSERKVRIGILARAEKGGVYFDEFVERLWHNEDGNREEDIDDVRNAVIDALRDANSPTKALQILRESANKSAEPYTEMDQEDFDLMVQYNQEQATLNQIEEDDYYWETISVTDEDLANAEKIAIEMWLENQNNSNFVENLQSYDQQQGDTASNEADRDIGPSESDVATGSVLMDQGSPTADRGDEAPRSAPDTPDGARGVRETRAAATRAAQVEQRVAEIDVQLEAKRKEYNSTKQRIGKEYNADQPDLFGSSDNQLSAASEGGVLFDVQGDYSKQNISSILSSIQADIDRLESEKANLLNTKETSIAQAVEAERLQEELDYGEGIVRARRSSPLEDSKSLVGLHNISEEKLRKALKIGGLANPSVAIIDTNTQHHTGYGDISFVLPSSLVEKKTGRNIGTFFGDAWTPVYPEVQRQFGKKGSKKASQDIAKLPDEMQGVVRLGLNSWLDGRNGDGLQYMFLYERGNAPELYRQKPQFSEELRNAVIEATDKKPFYNLTSEQRQQVLNLYIQERYNGDKTQYDEHLQRVRNRSEKVIQERGENSLVGRKAKEVISTLDEYGYDYESVSGFLRDILNDIDTVGVIDPQYTELLAENKIRDEHLEDEYGRWLSELVNRYDVKEVIFKGYTPLGNRRYVPHTLENVSKEMREQGRNGATGLGLSFTNFAAKLLKPEGKLSDIRKRKGQLRPTDEEVEAFKEKWSKVFYDLGVKLQPNASIYEDYGLHRLAEVATMENPNAYLKKEYGVELSANDVQLLKNMVKAIQTEYPVMYFETKFERPVYFNEFAGAVIPNNTSEDIKQALSEQDLNVIEYAANDENARANAIKTIAELDDNKGNVLFQRGDFPEMPNTEANRRAYKLIREKLRKKGIEVHEVSEEMANAMASLIGVEFATKRKSATETVLPEDESSFKGTAISTADGAKILKNLDNLANKYQELSNRPWTFIGDVANALGISMPNKASKYGIFEAMNGNEITIRLSDHNATVSNLDGVGENNAISIVISRKPNNGITNDGNAHIVEYYYPASKIQKADGKPLVDIITSIKQALYSGEYEDITGLAEREEVNLSNAEYQIVYHGSGAKFDRFDHSFMGTGEGSQAYGWGTYVTQIKGIGEGYAKTIANKYSRTFRDYIYEDISNFDNGDFELAKQQLAEYYDSVLQKNPNNYTIESRRTYLQGITESEYKKSFIFKSPLLYIVNIPGSNGEYLQWEKTVSKYLRKKLIESVTEGNFGFWVPDHLREASREARAEYWMKETYPDNPHSGEAVYNLLSVVMGSDRAASAYLRDNGFVGIEYPAQYRSGGRADNAKNYVIFNENDLKIIDRVELFQDSQGKIYGWAVGGEIYLTPDGLNANTAIHEYSHLWVEALRKKDSKKWGEIKSQLKATPFWQQVLDDPNYERIRENEDAVASEVLARLTGKNGAERLASEAQRIIDAGNGSLSARIEATALVQRVKRLLRDLWAWVARNIFGVTNEATISQLSDTVVDDLLNEAPLTDAENSPFEAMFIGELGANVLDIEQKVSYRMANMDVAIQMEQAGKSPFDIKIATGWERGADGEWRYEISDAEAHLNIEAMAELNQRLDSGVRQRNADKLRQFEQNNPSLAKKRQEMIEKYSINSSAVEALDEVFELTPVVAEFKLRDLFDYDEAYEAYPQLMNTRVRVIDGMRSLGAHWGDNIDISLEVAQIPARMRATLLHEIQHSIQSIEGFAAGGNKEVAQELMREMEQEVLIFDFAGLVRGELQENPDLTDRQVTQKVISELKERTGLTREELESAKRIPSSKQRVEALAAARNPELYEYYWGVFQIFNAALDDEGNVDSMKAYRNLMGEVEARNTTSRRNMTAEQRRSSLGSATEDVNRGVQIYRSRQGDDSESLSEESKYSSRVEALSAVAHDVAAKLNAPIRVITDMNDVPQARQSWKGWWQRGESGEQIVIVVPNNIDAADIERTILHEAVAHYGLRKLLGEPQFNLLLDTVLKSMTEEEVQQRMRKYGTNDPMVVADEYIAEVAEGNVAPSMFERVVSAVRAFLRDVLGLSVQMTDNDIRYLLWQSKNALEGKSAFGRAMVMAQGKPLADMVAEEYGYARAYTAEEQQIIAEAQRNGTYLKAPNGKPTNLTPKQWVQVRTKAFKRWFGDWILPTMETPIHKSKGTFANLGEAEQWAKKNLQGQERENKYTGEKISIGRKSVSEMLNEKALKQSHSINAHLAALRSVLDFIETGIPAEVHPDTHGRDFDVMRLYNAIDIDNKVYRVKSTVRKVKQGDKYYTYEIQEMELIEERGANPNREGETPHNGNTSNNSITAAKLLKGVKKTNNDEDILSHSQILDANGEPLVVEHSTWNEDFYTFNIERLGESSGDEGLYGAGFYFGNVGHTQLYGDRAIRVYLDAKNPLVLPEDNIMKSFDYLIENFDKEGLRDIVVKNGKKSATLGKIIDVIKEVQAANANGEYDELIEQMKQYWSGAEDRVIEQTIFRKVGFAFYRALTPFIDENIGRREFSKSLQAAGYDGVIFDNREYVVYNPTQIKSAEINSGEFDPTDPDIRARRKDFLDAEGNTTKATPMKQAKEVKPEREFRANNLFGRFFETFWRYTGASQVVAGKTIDGLVIKAGEKELARRIKKGEELLRKREAPFVSAFVKKKIGKGDAMAAFQKLSKADKLQLSKVITGFNPVVDYMSSENRSESQGEYALKKYFDGFIAPLNESRRRMREVMGISDQELETYVSGESSLERHNSGTDALSTDETKAWSLKKVEGIVTRFRSRLRNNMELQLKQQGANALSEAEKELLGEDLIKKLTEEGYDSLSAGEQMAACEAPVEVLWERIRALNNEHLNILLRAGRYSHDDIERIKSHDWRYYVPMFKQDLNVEGLIDPAAVYDVDVFYGTPSAPSLKPALGRDTKSQDVFRSMYQLGQRCVVFEVRNRVARSLYDFTIWANDHLGVDETRKYWHDKMVYQTKTASGKWVDEDTMPTREELDQMHKTQREINVLQRRRKDITRQIDRLSREVEATLSESAADVIDDALRGLVSQRDELIQKIAELEKDRKWRAKKSNFDFEDPTSAQAIERERTVRIWIDGREHRMVFADPDIARAVNGTKNGIVKAIEALGRLVGPFTRFRAQMNTQYSPDFIVSNTLRDYQHALLAMALAEQGDITLSFAGNYFRHLGDVFRSRGINYNPLSEAELKGHVPYYSYERMRSAYIAAKIAGEQITEEEFDRAYRDEVALNRIYLEEVYGKARVRDTFIDAFQRYGGATGFIHQLNSKQIEKQLREAMLLKEDVLARRYVDPTTPFRLIRDVISRVSESMEDITRFATFMAHLDHGASVERAAQEAKEVTTNFNRRGELATGLGSLYMFFNASVQGSAQVMRLIKQHPRRAAAVLPLYALLGFMQRITRGMLWKIGAATGIKALFFDDDDEERPRTEEQLEKEKAIRDYMYSDNLIIVLDRTLDAADTALDGIYLRIPQPNGFRAAYKVGVELAEVAMGEQRWDELPESLISTLAGEFVYGFGDTGELTSDMWRMVIPSAVQPISDLLLNKDFVNRTIYNEREYNPIAPAYTVAKSNTPSLYIDASRILNSIGGTDTRSADYNERYEKRAIGLDVPPEAIKYLVGEMFGGVGTFANRMWTTVELMTDGEKGNLAKRDIPFVNRVIGEFEPENVWPKYKSLTDQIEAAWSESSGFRAEQGIDMRKSEWKDPDVTYPYLIEHYKDNPYAVEMLRKRWLLAPYFKEIEDYTKSLKRLGEGASSSDRASESRDMSSEAEIQQASRTLTEKFILELSKHVDWRVATNEEVIEQVEQITGEIKGKNQ